MDPVEGPAYHHQKVSQAASLKDLEEEYVFFTHAILFTHADFDRDPVYDFVTSASANLAGDCPPFHITFPNAVFQGLDLDGDPAWNFRVIAAPRSYWPRLDSWLGSLTGVDRDKKLWQQVISQILPVPDGLALARAAILPIPCPMVDVVVFGFSGNQKLVAMEPARNPPIDLPKVVVHPPEEIALRHARALFGEQNPFSPQQQGG